MDKVSVIIPSRNRRENIEKLIGNIKNLDYKNLEIIVVDDASEPAYSAINDSVLILRNDERMGAVISRNKGIFHSSGEYILMLDDDIEIASVDFIKKSLRILKKNPEIKMVVPKKIDTTGKGESDVSCFKPRIDGFLFPVRADPGFVEFGCMVYIVEKATLLEIGGYDDSFGPGHSYREESDLQIRIRKKGYKIYFKPDLKILHRITREGGQEQSFEEKAYWIARNHVIFLKKHFSFWFLRALIFLFYHVIGGNFKSAKYGIKGWMDGVRWVI